MEKSLWKESASAPRFKCLPGDMKTDVLIVGGGMAGVLCAYMLKQAGVEYALIEAKRIGQGVTADTTAKITSQHGLIYHKLKNRYSQEHARGYWEINEKAIGKYRDLAQRIPCDFESKDNMIYSLQDEALLEKEFSALEEMGIPVSFTKSVSIPLDTVGALRFSGQAQFHPLKFLCGIARNLNIYENTEAVEFHGNTVITNRGKITAKKVIIATHFPLINKHGSYFIKMYQDRSYVLALKDAQPVGGMYLAAEETGFSFRDHKGILLLGGGGHRTGKPGQGWSVLEDFAKLHYPGSQIISRWATQDCITLDGIPYIGRYSKSTPNLYVSTGFNKWGMSSSMTAAMILADLIQGKENPYAWIFSPSRTMLHPKLFSNVLESTTNLLRPTVPRCPHLGCALQWNRHERSWDCPCHGSRFSENGTRLDNPATGNMKHRQSP